MIRLLCALSVLAMTISGCYSTSRLAGEESNENSRWIMSVSQPPRGTVIVVHGLNQRPSSMDELSEFIASLKFDVLRLSLAGHGSDPGESEGESRSAWVDDVHRAYVEAAAKAPGRPIHLLGYSLGGLVVVNAVDRNADINPTSLILLAPALSLRPVIHLIRFSLLLPFSSISVPSFSPIRYRRHSSTSLQCYANFIRLFDATSKLQSPERLASIPASVTMSSTDELVSLPGVKDWIKRNNLMLVWEVSEVRPEPNDISFPGHLFIDRFSAGNNTWEQLTSMIKSQLLPEKSTSH